MIAQGSAYFFPGVSVFSLLVFSLLTFSLLMAVFFVRRVVGSGIGTPDMQRVSARNRRAGRRAGLEWRMKSNLFSRRFGRFAGVMAGLMLLAAGAAFAAPVQAGGEANLRLPDLTRRRCSFSGMNGHSLLMYGPLACILGMIFGLFMYVHLKGLPVHRAMQEVSQLIWETCKTYLINQGKFLLLLWSFIAVVILVYFAVLLHFSAARVASSSRSACWAWRAVTLWRGSASA